MVNPGLAVKGLPAGWKILQFARAPNHPQDGIILCERTIDHPDPNDMPYVTWYVNLEMGGCHHGHYFDRRATAELDFSDRCKAQLK